MAQTDLVYNPEIAVASIRTLTPGIRNAVWDVVKECDRSTSPKIIKTLSNLVEMANRIEHLCAREIDLK